ncbi:sensor histidine kinase [Runella sp.]|uniref:sensor histidine kinase n=1 Tax=Runella sp. TaxID=1960881 RepID=UPI003D10BEC9
MTLINKATRSFLLACVLASALGGVSCFFFLKKIMDNEASDQLLHEKEQVENYVGQVGILPRRWFSISDSLWAVRMHPPVPMQMSDTILYSPVNKEYLAYRQLSFGIGTFNGYYQVNIRKAMYETHNLTQALLLAFSGLTLLLMGLLLIINYQLSNSLWQPFYQTLATLRTFQLGQPESLRFRRTSINEFQTLQASLKQLTDQLRRDYQSLKTFTENASHELQTPLAVINSNLEMLIQAPNLTEEQMERIGHLIETVGNLSKMNQTLVLLTKIENRQFSEEEELNISELLNEKVNLWEALIRDKGIALTTEIAPDVRLKMNAFLADVLLNNLLGNALKHNTPSGSIRIVLTSRKLEILNKGLPPSVPISQLWERFSKGSTRSDSVGLGLALVRQIADNYGFKANYDYQEGWHILSIHFF